MKYLILLLIPLLVSCDLADDGDYGDDSAYPPSHYHEHPSSRDDHEHYHPDTQSSEIIVRA